MKNKVFIGIGMGVSFIAGTVAGYFLRKKTEVTFEEVTEEELQEYAKQCEKLEQGTDSEEKHDDESGESDDSDDSDGQSDIAFKEGSEDSATTVDTRKVDYSKMWKGNNGAVNEAVTKASSVYARHGEPGSEESLEVVDEELNCSPEEPADDLVPSSGLEFYSSGPYDEYTRRTIIWYGEDDVVTEMDEDDDHGETEVVLSNPERELGFDLKKEWANADENDIESLGTASSMYRRNDHKDIIYQLIHQPGSYNRRKAQEQYGGWK